MMKYHIFVSGRVQGVGFRWYAQRIAERMRVTGWVKNLMDGKVEILIEGDGKELDEFLNELKEGYLGRNIEKLEKVESKGAGTYTGFSIVF